MSEKTIEERAMNWIVNGRVGISSRTIWSVMMTGKPPKNHSHPHDPDDLSRCLLLLEIIPEWRERLHLMRGVSKYWDGLVSKWDDVEHSFYAERDLPLRKQRDPSTTYELMRSIFDSVRSERAP